MDDLIREMLEPERPAPGVVARRRRFVATLSIIGLAALGVTSLTTNALFTNTDTTGQSGFVAGTVVIDSTPTDFAIDESVGAAPGDTFYAPVVVRNDGTLQLRYSIELGASEDSDDAVLDELTYSVLEGVTAANCAAGNVSAGVELGSGVLGNGQHWIGDATPGENDGDRELDSGASETLCVGLEFSRDAGDDVQGARAGLSFTFHAEQTANNP